MKLFGEYIRELREERKLPLRKVAAFLDIDTSILSKVERGERIISSELVVKISEFFELDEKQLLTEYLGEEVARKVYTLNNVSQVLKSLKRKPSI